MSRLRTDGHSVNTVGSEVETRCPDCSGQLDLVQGQYGTVCWCEFCEMDHSHHVAEVISGRFNVAFARDEHNKLVRYARHITKRYEDVAAVIAVVICSVLHAPLSVIETEFDGDLSPSLKSHIGNDVARWRESQPADPVKDILKRRPR